MIKENHTFCVYADNAPGIIHRAACLFTKRKVNIESLSASETETEGVSRFTVVATCDNEVAQKIARQIRRIIEVHEVFVCKDEEILSREVAMIKVKRVESDQFNAVKKQHGLSVVHEYPESIVLEKTGTECEISAAAADLKPFEVLEFVRSGRIGMRRDGVRLQDVWQHTDRDEPSEGMWI